MDIEKWLKKAIEKIENMPRDEFIDSLERAGFELEDIPKEGLNICPKCSDTGMTDSGGVQPWGEPIEIECDCQFEDRQNDKN